MRMIWAGDDGLNRVRGVGRTAAALSLTLFLVSFLVTGCALFSESTDESIGHAASKARDTEANARSVALAARALASFGPLPSSVPNPQNVGLPAKLDLGRMLYYEPRLSKNQDISCNSCHLLDAFGVDG